MYLNNTLENAMKKTKKHSIYAVLLLFTIVIVLIWRNRSNKVDHLYDMTHKIIGITNSIPRFEAAILNEDGSYIFVPGNNEAYHLFIFFTPWDCNKCLKEIPLWNHLGELDKNRLEVIAIGIADTFSMLETFVKENGFKIMTLYDKKEELFSLLKLNDSFLTPVKILVDSKGKVLDIRSAFEQEPSGQDKYIKYIESIIK